jgi:hypothetical protein
MRNHWRPDRRFLERRTREQLVAIATDCGYAEGAGQVLNRDFGTFTMQDVPEKIFWKIDYYADKSCATGSEHPADPAQTFRVLTIMLASEW